MIIIEHENSMNSTMRENIEERGSIFTPPSFEKDETPLSLDKNNFVQFKPNSFPQTAQQSRTNK